MESIQLEYNKWDNAKRDLRGSNLYLDSEIKEKLNLDGGDRMKMFCAADKKGKRYLIVEKYIW